MTYSTFRLYIFCQYVCSLGIEPTTFALLTQCSTTEPQGHTVLHQYCLNFTTNVFTTDHCVVSEVLRNAVEIKVSDQSYLLTALQEEQYLKESVRMSKKGFWTNRLRRPMGCDCVRTVTWAPASTFISSIISSLNHAWKEKHKLVLAIFTSSSGQAHTQTLNKSVPNNHRMHTKCSLKRSLEELTRPEVKCIIDHY